MHSSKYTGLVRRCIYFDGVKVLGLKRYKYRYISWVLYKYMHVEAGKSTKFQKSGQTLATSP